MQSWASLSGGGRGRLQSEEKEAVWPLRQRSGCYHSQGSLEPLDDRRGKELILPKNFYREHGPPSSLISAQWNRFHTSGLWNYDLIHVYCFKFVVTCYSSLSKLTHFPCHRARQEQAQCLEYCKFGFYSLRLWSKPPKLGGTWPTVNDLPPKKRLLFLREKKSLTRSSAYGTMTVI